MDMPMKCNTKPFCAASKRSERSCLIADLALPAKQTGLLWSTKGECSYLAIISFFVAHLLTIHGMNPVTLFSIINSTVRSCFMNIDIESSPILNHTYLNPTFLPFSCKSTVQAEKALCQQNCLLMDGILIGVTRLTLPLKQSLEWSPTSLSSLPDVTSRLDTKFENDMMKEEDILVLSLPEKKESLAIGSKRNVCERILSWWFGW